MKKKHFILILMMFMVCAFVKPFFSFAGVDDAVAYLKGQPSDAWSVQALAASGEVEFDGSFLTSVSGNLATDYAKAILGVVAIGENPVTFGNIDYVSKLKSFYNDGQMGDSGLVNDDIWSILALSAVGEGTSIEAVGAKNFILTNQNPDGGWGYLVQGTSDSNDTAAAIISLLELGVSKTDTSITKATAFLQSLQNPDGGFGWEAGSSSDSGSDAWVICALNKLGISSSDWDKNGSNPQKHLESLQDSDGGFWWVTPGSSDYNNKAMTAYALIALSGKSFPVAYHLATPDSPVPGEYHLRIEGSSGNICDVFVAGDNALDLLINAADECSYTYNIDDTAYGPYLNQVNDDVAVGMEGWLYFVNNESPAVGAADYSLNEGDEILFFFGEWGWKPSRLTVEKDVVNSGEAVNVLVEYYEGSDWKALEGAVLKGLSNNYTVNASGEAVLDLAEGVYLLYAESPTYVRSNVVTVTVGNGVAQNVGLLIEIEQGESPDVAGESLIFEVTPGQLDFGKIKPGEGTSKDLTLKNSGTVDLIVKSSVGGDELFVENVKIGSQIWSVFEESLAGGVIKPASVSIAVPADYIGSGVKSGEIIFWGIPQ